MYTTTTLISFKAIFSLLLLSVIFSCTKKKEEQVPQPTPVVVTPPAYSCPTGSSCFTDGTGRYENAYDTLDQSGMYFLGNDQLILKPSKSNNFPEVGILIPGPLSVGTYNYTSDNYRYPIGFIDYKDGTSFSSLYYGTCTVTVTTSTTTGMIGTFNFVSKTSEGVFRKEVSGSFNVKY